VLVKHLFPQHNGLSGVMNAALTNLAALLSEIRMESINNGREGELIQVLNIMA
jgi:hypothetical protein